MLLASGEPAEALAAYEASLVNDPKRLRSLYGAGVAAAAAGNADKARDNRRRACVEFVMSRHLSSTPML